MIIPCKLGLILLQIENKSFGSFEELQEAAKDGVLLCTLFATLAPDSMDVRCINRKNLDDPEQVIVVLWTSVNRCRSWRTILCF